MATFGVLPSVQNAVPDWGATTIALTQQLDHLLWKMSGGFIALIVNRQKDRVIVPRSDLKKIGDATQVNRHLAHVAGVYTMHPSLHGNYVVDPPRDNALEHITPMNTLTHLFENPTFQTLVGEAVRTVGNYNPHVAQPYSLSITGTMAEFHFNHDTGKLYFSDNAKNGVGRHCHVLTPFPDAVEHKRHQAYFHSQDDAARDKIKVPDTMLQVNQRDFQALLPRVESSSTSLISRAPTASSRVKLAQLRR